MHIGFRDAIKSVVSGNSPTMTSDPLEGDRTTLKGYGSLLTSARKEILEAQNFLKTSLCKRSSAEMRQALIDACTIATEGQTKAIRCYDDTFAHASTEVSDKYRPVLEKLVFEIDRQLENIRKAENRLAHRDKLYAKMMTAKGDLESAKATGNKVEKCKQAFEETERAFQQSTSEAEVDLKQILVIYQSTLEEIFTKLFATQQDIYNYFYCRMQEVNDRLMNPAKYSH